jgi:hypothetical protein
MNGEIVSTRALDPERQRQPRPTLDLMTTNRSLAVGSVLVAGMFAVAGCASEGADEDAFWESVRSEAQTVGENRSTTVSLGRTFCEELDDPAFEGMSRSERELEVQASAVDLAQSTGAGADDILLITAVLESAFHDICP